MTKLTREQEEAQLEKVANYYSVEGWCHRHNRTAKVLRDPLIVENTVLIYYDCCHGQRTIYELREDESE